VVARSRRGAHVDAGYPIARLYTDARVARSYPGTSEVLTVIIAKSLGR
jgi:acyl-CoA dehydrogenase